MAARYRQRTNAEPPGTARCWRPTPGAPASNDRHRVAITIVRQHVDPGPAGLLRPTRYRPLFTCCRAATRVTAPRTPPRCRRPARRLRRRHRDQPQLHAPRRVSNPVAALDPVHQGRNAARAEDEPARSRSRRRPSPTCSARTGPPPKPVAGPGAPALTRTGRQDQSHAGVGAHGAVVGARRRRRRTGPALTDPRVGNSIGATKRSNDSQASTYCHRVSNSQGGRPSSDTTRRTDRGRGRNRAHPPTSNSGFPSWRTTRCTASCRDSA